MNKIQSKKYIEMKVSEPSYYMYHEITLVYHDSQNATEITQFPQIAKNIKSIVFKIFETLNRNVAELR